MKNRLIIVEGLPCSGKSSISAFVASELEKNQLKVCFVDEGTGDHPADYEFHAYAPAGLVSEEAQIVPLSQYEGALFEQLLQYKIYDFLPWEVEKPLMLDKWRQFVDSAEVDTIYVFNCVLLQNPMCETMMRFGFSEEASQQYIEEIVEVISEMKPLVIYLKNDDIEVSVTKASAERENWLVGIIDYHENGAFGKSIQAQGFDGYIACLKERQERELRILDQLPVGKIVIDNAQRDWKSAQAQIQAFLSKS